MLDLVTAISDSQFAQGPSLLIRYQKTGFLGKMATLKLISLSLQTNSDQPFSWRTLFSDDRLY